MFFLPLSNLRKCKLLRRQCGRGIRALGFSSGGPGSRLSTLLPVRFVLGCSHFDSLAALCIQPTGLPLSSWDVFIRYVYIKFLRGSVRIGLESPFEGEIN